MTNYFWIKTFSIIKIRFLRYNCLWLLWKYFNVYRLQRDFIDIRYNPPYNLWRTPRRYTHTHFKREYESFICEPTHKYKFWDHCNFVSNSCTFTVSILLLFRFLLIPKFSSRSLNFFSFLGKMQRFSIIWGHYPLPSLYKINNEIIGSLTVNTNFHKFFLSFTILEAIAIDTIQYLYTGRLKKDCNN